MKTQTRKEKRKIAFWVSLDAQGIGLIGCSGEGLKLDRGKVRLGGINWEVGINIYTLLLW